MKTRFIDDERIACKKAPVSVFYTFLASERLLFVCLLFVVLSLGVDLKLFAQSRVQQGGDASPSGGALFVPSRDVNSSAHFSTVDAARRNRPPEPSKSREDLFYPDGFLTLSSPTPEPAASKTSTNASSLSKKSELEDRGVQLRPLDPSVETTPVKYCLTDSLA